MSLHINRFVDRVRSAEHRGQRDFVMTLAEARELQADMIKLLLALQTMAEAQATTTTTNTDSGAQEIAGGSF